MRGAAGNDGCNFPSVRGCCFQRPGVCVRVHLPGVVRLSREPTAATRRGGGQAAAAATDLLRGVGLDRVRRHALALPPQTPRAWKLHGYVARWPSSSADICEMMLGGYGEGSCVVSACMRTAYSPALLSSCCRTMSAELRHNIAHRRLQPDADLRAAQRDAHRTPHNGVYPERGGQVRRCSELLRQQRGGGQGDGPGARVGLHLLRLAGLQRAESVGASRRACWHVCVQRRRHHRAQLRLVRLLSITSRLIHPQDSHLTSCAVRGIHAIHKEPVPATRRPCPAPPHRCYRPPFPGEGSLHLARTPGPQPHGITHPR